MAKPAGYSGKPLWQKLGLKPGMSCLPLNPPGPYQALVDGAQGIDFIEKGPADIVHLFCRVRADLEAEIAPALAQVSLGGMLWVSWPKKSSALFRDLTEDMLRMLAEDILGTTELVNTVRDTEGNVVEEKHYDFGKPFDRLSMGEAILKYWPEANEAAIRDPEAHLDELKAMAKQLHIKEPEVDGIWGAGKYLCEIFEATAEEKLEQPTFITEYPWEVSPLARRNDANPFITDRFEFFVGGRELANGFSELNDPEDQAERFRKQVEEKDAGDDEAMHYDEDYIRALEFGLPPTAGEGIGIDRLTMLFTDSPTIKDVILFPHMKPEVQPQDAE